MQIPFRGITGKAKQIATVSILVIPVGCTSVQEPPLSAASFDRQIAQVEQNRRARAAILTTNFGPSYAVTTMVKYHKEKEALQAGRAQICIGRHGNYDPSDDSYQDENGQRLRCE